MTMKTNEPLQEEKENEISQPTIEFNRKTITVGEQPKRKDYSFLLGILIATILFGMGLRNNVDWDLATNVPTIQDKPNFFKTIRSKQYFKSVVVPTPIPAPVDEELESEMAVKATSKKIEIGPATKKKISYSDVPNYHAYDELIIRESKKYKGVKPVVIKAIIEQESHYNPSRIKYESKWERDYGPSIKKKKNENIEEWKMNFHSFGLMQVGYALHKDFCGLTSYTDLYNPSINIQCGTKIYNSCIEAGNSETFCIKKYNGSGPATEKYKNEVLSRVARILSVPTKLMS